MKKTILVTGAIGGIGTAIVNEFSALPDTIVIATDISAAILNAYANRENIIPHILDVTSTESLNTLKTFIENQGLQIHTLINNAGVIDFFPLSEASLEELNFIFGVNTFGPINTIRTFLEHLIANKGRIVQMSSESTKLMGPFQPYNASKKALDALTASMRSELQLKEVELVSIKSGAIATPLLNAIKSPQVKNKDSVYTKEFGAFGKMLSEIKLKTIQPEKLAKLVVKAGTIKNPKLVYMINATPFLTLMSFLGERIRSRLMTWQLQKRF